jgi:hypothetical protein
MPAKSRQLKVAIDASLAAQYRTAYKRTFGQADRKRRSLSDFISGFLEDRLAEEIEFARREMPRARK